MQAVTEKIARKLAAKRNRRLDGPWGAYVLSLALVVEKCTKIENIEVSGVAEERESSDDDFFLGG